MAYGDWILNIEVPLSNAVSNAALAFNTIYDTIKGNKDTSAKTIKRVHEPFNELRWLVDASYFAKRQVTPIQNQEVK
jgi:hypothetical protein